MNLIPSSLGCFSSISLRLHASQHLLLLLLAARRVAVVELLRFIDKRRHGIFGGLLDHAVAQVEHMTRSGLGHAVTHRCPNLALGAEEDEGVDVARHAHAGPEPLPRHRHVHLPVDADHVRLHVLLALEVRRPAVGKVDQRRVRVPGPDPLDNLVGVGLGEEREVVRAKVVCPRLENLQYLSTALDLMAGVVGDVVGHVLEERVHDLRLVVHHLLRLKAVLVRFPLHGVRGQREWGPNETQQSRLPLRLLAQASKDLADERRA
mmetsp:Transcript_49498/g.99287  ORF Transcript_49498/g.99287 Transcript_49498/m.99287 type:complete len:263 (+) Transcript_49498:117-905(+)